MKNNLDDHDLIYIGIFDYYLVAIYKVSHTSFDFHLNRYQGYYNMSTSLSRRNLLGTALASLAVSNLSACGGETEYLNGEAVRTEKDVWTERANRLEKLTIYSESNLPADPEANKPAAHLPMVMIDQAAGYANVFINHVMQPAHWITTVYFRDQDGTVFYLKELLPGDVDLDAGGNPVEKGVTVSVKIPQGTTQVAAFAFCNLHIH